MARKITKNSRNARQAAGAYDDVNVQSLAEIPRAEKTDLSNILIRTAAKNEALLDAKINKKRKDKKKINKKTLQDKLAQSVTLMDKERLERALNISNRLDGKISKSISRAKYVQNSRKAGWDMTNESIKRDLNLLNKNDSIEKTSKGNTEEMEDDMEEAFDADKVEKKEVKPSNIFALLDTEVEE